MLDKFDYAEPRCPLCCDEGFYYPKNGTPHGRIPVFRIIEKADSLFAKNNYTEAVGLLEYWLSEAVSLRDKSGELAITNELIGLYRKQNEKEKGLDAIKRAISLTEELSQNKSASGGTIILNCATAYNAFGMPEEALPLFLTAEMIYEDTVDKCDARFGGLYNNMASTLFALGYLDDAETAYLSALGIMKNIPQGDGDCAITYLNLAELYEALGNDGKTAECVDAAFKCLESESLPHNGYYAFVTSKCAPSFAHFGRWDIYEKLMAESEKIYAGN